MLQRALEWAGDQLGRSLGHGYSEVTRARSRAFFSAKTDSCKLPIVT